MKKIILLLLMVTGLTYSGELLKVIKIVDGDTIHALDVDNKDRYIRLSYIDTMESVHNNRAKKLATECNLDINDIVKSGKEAKAYLNTLIPIGTMITVEFHGMDSRNARDMGEIFVDGKSINEEMVRSSHALPYYYFIKDKDVYTRYSLAYVESNTLTTPVLNNECVKKFEK